MTVPGAVRALAAGGRRIAWISADRRLHILGQPPVSFTQQQYVNRNDPFADGPELAFAGSHPVWGDARGRPEVLESVYTSDAGGRLNAQELALTERYLSVEAATRTTHSHGDTDNPADFTTTIYRQRGL